MATVSSPCTWKRGFAEPAEKASWTDEANYLSEMDEKSHYNIPPSQDALTSTTHNSFGQNLLKTWPTLYNGTESPSGIPGGPFGLEIALSLARQGLSFRIVDKAEAPLLAGRADGVQPRALELLHSWGLAQEVHEEGPVLNTTALFKDGAKLFYNWSSQCDSRYKGIHIITQGQMERIYIRDLLRHKVLVERCTVVDGFEVGDESLSSHPVKATLKNLKTGRRETIRAKYLVGGDGAASSIREQLKIPFDGNTTDIYWAIMDCVFKTDYPHILDFSIITRAEHGGCIIIPREQGYTRFYTQLNGEKARQLAKNRQARRNASAVGDTRIDDHGITAEEVLELTNKILDPYTVEFASSLSWFSVWKVSERVARSFSSPDLRVHIGGDAAHVHSVLGAFGLNSSIYDAANLGWKLGLCVHKLAKPSSLLPTYDQERRLFANRVIRCSGTYLRFICNSALPLAELRGLGEELETHDECLPIRDGTREADVRFLGAFFSRNAKFLLGVEVPIVESAICPPMPKGAKQTPITVLNGARAPNPRVCFGPSYTSYLYDKMTGSSRFHLLIFASDLRGIVRERVARFSQQGLGPGGFFARFGGRSRFNIVLVIKALPHETEELLSGSYGEDNDLSLLRDNATLVFDDRSPDEDAHYWYGINHARGAVVVVRPDLWVGMSAWPEDMQALDQYFAGFLVEPSAAENLNGSAAEVNGVVGAKGLGGAYGNGHGNGAGRVDDNWDGVDVVAMNGRDERKRNGNEFLYTNNGHGVESSYTNGYGEKHINGSHVPNGDVGAFVH